MNEQTENPVGASFAAIAVIDIVPNPDKKSSRVEACELHLETSNNVDDSKYFQSETVFTKEGVKALTYAFIHGLATAAKKSELSGFSTFDEARETTLKELNRVFDYVKTMEG